MSTSSNRKAIIIGAGMGGLSAAIALNKIGISVEIYEQAKKLRDAGTAISITTNGMNALKALGVDGAMMDAGEVITDMYARETNGDLITRMPVDKVGEKLGAPTVMVHRKNIQNTLLSFINCDQLHLGKELDNFKHTKNGVRVTFKDGSVVEGDMLIGADGNHSAVRNQMFGLDDARHTHYVAWLATTNFEHPVVTKGSANHYWGQGERFGLMDLGDGQVYWWGTKNTKQVAERLQHISLLSGDNNDADKAEIVNTYRDWSDEVVDVIACTPAENIIEVNTRDRKPLKKWGEKGVTLLGDAAHPALTSLGMGAAQAFEDSVVLMKCLESTHDVNKALRLYEKHRIPLTTKRVNLSRNISDMEQVENKWLAKARNTAFRVMPEKLIEIILTDANKFSIPENK